jgi:hypothetical protein
MTCTQLSLAAAALHIAVAAAPAPAVVRRRYTHNAIMPNALRAESARDAFQLDIAAIAIYLAHCCVAKSKELMFIILASKRICQQIFSNLSLWMIIFSFDL